jgi:hypothetical protein
VRAALNGRTFGPGGALFPMRASWGIVLLLAAALAGCSNPQRDTLRAVYPGDFDITGAVPVVHGAHLEGRVGDGPWQPEISIAVEAPLLAGPAMAAAAPQGGGGDTQRLPGVNATIEVRIKEAARLGGLTAHWFILDNQTMSPTDLVPETAKLPGDGTFRATVGQPGTLLVKAILTGSSVDDATQAAFEPLRVHLQVTWTATGQVQPVRQTQAPVGPPPPQPTPRDQMVDRYEADVRPGAHLVASTTFDGTFSGRQGTDVDVGLYAPDGTPLACGSTGGSAVPVVGQPSPVPDPAQASEAAAGDATAGGLWTAQVGAQQDGCTQGMTYYYANAGPVPYRLVLVAS